jgi:hypothetical protein
VHWQQSAVPGVRVGVGTTTTIAPLLPIAPGSGWPSGLSKTTPVTVSGYAPGAAPAAMLTLQVYKTDPSGIGAALSVENTVACTDVQAGPPQPSGRKAKVVAGFRICGFTAQSGSPLGSAAMGVRKLSKPRSFSVRAMLAPLVLKVAGKVTC